MNFYYLALQAAEGIGSRGARRLLEHFGNPRELLKARTELLLKIRGLGPQRVRNLKSKEILIRAEGEWLRAEKANVRMISIADSEYPERLRDCPDAPLILFVRGDLRLSRRRVISIVGTRKMTAQGEAFLRSFFRGLQRYDPVVVSGLAYGVDVCAHRLSLKHGLSTIGVMAHGMDRIYPRAHYKTALEMTGQGALLTEFWMGTAPARENFVKRNRIIAGISEATLVVESSDRGGSLVTADLADSYHRDVFAVPGRAGDPFSEGCNHLIKTNRAALLTKAEDLEYMLNWKPVRERSKEDEAKIAELSGPGEKMVCDILRQKGRMHSDQIARESGMHVKELHSILLRLEIAGLIRGLSGKHYEFSG